MFETIGFFVFILIGLFSGIVIIYLYCKFTGKNFREVNHKYSYSVGKISLIFFILLYFILLGLLN